MQFDDARRSAAAARWQRNHPRLWIGKRRIHRQKRHAASKSGEAALRKKDLR